MKYRIRPELRDKEWESNADGLIELAQGTCADPTWGDKRVLFEPVRPKLYARLWMDDHWCHLYESRDAAEQSRPMMTAGGREEFERICKAAFPDHEIEWVES